METFSALLAICAGNSPVTSELPAQRPVTRSFDVFFDRGLNKRLSKRSGGWWFGTPPRPLWRQRNDVHGYWNVRSVYVDELGHHWFRYDIPEMEFIGHWWIPLAKASHAEHWCFLWTNGLNKRLSNQSRRRWLETSPRSLWRHSNVIIQSDFLSFMLRFVWVDCNMEFI